MIPQVGHDVRVKRQKKIERGGRPSQLLDRLIPPDPPPADAGARVPSEPARDVVPAPTPEKV
ncbi:MAG: hypothetical protein E6G60_18010 [Actinobacteria bacterium]|nr:MAG: hypothetical protein E6G60_18010 [Actinomycetota bacterium]